MGKIVKTVDLNVIFDQLLDDSDDLKQENIWYITL